MNIDVNSIIVAPSILAADYLDFKSEIESIEQAGADWHHFDVMDGHFVPNLTFGPPVIAAFKKKASIPVDVHIMISNAEQVFQSYLDAGADCLSFHYEAVNHHHRVIQEIKKHGAKAGIALNPSTPASVLSSIVDDLDFVTVMSVNPGFGGQSFIKQAVDKVAEIRAMNPAVGIQVDGGINAETAPLVKNAGANILVAGTYVYGHKDRRLAIDSLRS